MTPLTIEHGIPIPAQTGGRPAIWPFRQMDVGDSFLYPCDDKGKEAARAKVYSAIKHASRRKMRFATRTLEGGIRVWRTK